MPCNSEYMEQNGKEARLQTGIDGHFGSMTYLRY